MRFGAVTAVSAVPVRFSCGPSCAKLDPALSVVTVPPAVQKHIGRLVAVPQFVSPAFDDAVTLSSAKVVN